MDGTLTPVRSTWRYLHDAFGTWQLGKLLADQYYAGAIDYGTWAQRDAELWRGIKRDEVEEIMKQIPYYEGAVETICGLRWAGLRVGLVSAGIEFLASRVERELGMDFAVANQLLCHKGRLTGEVVVKVSLENKVQVMRRIADEGALSLDDCATIGDTAYDLPTESGLRIAFNPSDLKTRQIANVTVEGSNLQTVLQYII